MAIYQATKNIYFSQLDKAVIVDDLIELDEAYAKEVNKNLKDTFPDVKEVLVLVDKAGTLEPEEDPIEEVAADEE
jgi:hypothetical protein|nr:MAG TPA: hypothetical protein [Caudoviricetes sp.]